MAVDHLRSAGALTSEQEATYFDVDDWFNDHLPNPPFSDDGNSVAAVTWFKTPIPTPMADRLRGLRGILTAHHVEHDEVHSDDPGEVIYSDDFQVGVLPRVRRPPSPLPDGVTLGPTSGGSNRRFARPQGDHTE